MFVVATLRGATKTVILPYCHRRFVSPNPAPKPLNKVACLELLLLLLAQLLRS